MRSEGPYQGPSGPSFPYQMYPQNTRVARTMSVATASTAAVPERPYEGPAGPTHPYGMYPQGVTPDAHEGLPAATIPVGFPGLNSDYHRRIGPEGEEAADIIGPDGHTEQLPPYTQYPDDAVARKVRGLVVPALPAGAVGAGAGGLGLATRNPEFDDTPREEAASPLAQADRNSVVSRGSSQQTVLNSTDAVSEKPQLKHWQIVAKRKVCGIVPIWVFVLIAITLLLMTAILAGVLTALKPKKRHDPKPLPDQPLSETSPQTTVVYATVTTTFDAKPTTAPTSFPTLPTGSFGLMLGLPDDTQTDCIQNSAQLNAWSCQVPPIPISINVATNETTNSHTAILTAGQNINSWNYGTQPPIVNVTKKLDLVIDVENPSYGPAWFFQVPYNKLIVLHENELSMSTTSTGKRQASFNPSGGNLNRNSAAQPGDQPWFCYWNGTLLETFIYANQTSAAGAQEASASSAYASSTTTSPSSSANNAAYASSTETETYASPTPESRRRRQAAGSYPSAPPQMSGLPSFQAGYPKIVKIEERRIPEGALTVAPNCVQMTINSDGSPSPLLNSSGLPIQIVLNETDPSLSEMRKRGYANLPRRDTDPTERSDISGDCSCVWMAT